MLPFGLVEAVTSTLDLPNVWRTVSLTAQAMAGQILEGKL